LEIGTECYLGRRSRRYAGIETSFDGRV
jgi:hypothetical protein